MSKKFELIASATSTTRTISFTSIPATYDDLRIIWSGRTEGLGTVPNVDTYFNNDTTGANYLADILGVELNTPRRYQATTIAWWYTNGASATSSLFNTLSAYIPSYRSTAYKAAFYDTWAGSSGDALIYATAFNWLNTSAITQIDMRFTDSSYTWSTGSVISLYGIKNS